MKNKPVVLIIRDGWGSNPNPEHDSFNAIKLADTPVADAIARDYPRTEILACGRAVGLPDAVMGNSEVGHQNLGAGRIVDQEIVRITKGFETGSIRSNEVILEAFKRERAGGKLHLFGLVSDAGVHAMLEHLYGLLDIAKTEGLQRVYIHAFTDGRDTPPFSGKNYLAELEAKIKEYGIGQIASVSGRFWSMDRDLRWDRVQKAFDCITGRAIERTASSALEAVEHYYENPFEPTCKGDEFILPTAMIDDEGKPVAIVEDGDAVIFFNFRGDRPREITRAFIQDDFDGFDRGKKLDLYYATMTEYQKGLCPNLIFGKPPKMTDILASYIADKGLTQFRCAETEKYPHVTFFFNDYREEPFPGEDRQIIQSPKDVSTYDQKPEMSARGVCDATHAAILSGKYDLIVVNFANPDMVGHTGSLEAAIKACAFVDGCVGELLAAVDQMNGAAIVTADHGNSDQLWEPSINGAHTAHTLNPVEVVLVGKACKGLKLRQTGKLGDIAPTLLALMGLPKPEAMTGENLIIQ